MKLRKKRKIVRKVLGVGYPWYVWEQPQEGFDPEGNGKDYYSLRLYSKPNSFGFPKGTQQLHLNPVEGAYKKVRVIVEYEK